MVTQGKESLTIYPNPMKTASCLILEKTDLTRAGALKPAAFEAFAKHDVVIRDSLVIKYSMPTPASSKTGGNQIRRRNPAPPAAPIPSAVGSSHTPDTPEACPAQDPPAA